MIRARIIVSIISGSLTNQRIIVTYHNKDAMRNLEKELFFK